MGRSLNLWLALLVVVCGVSLWLAGGGTLPQVAGGPSDSRLADEAEPGTVVSDPVHLLVLNGAGVPGLAREVSLQVVPLGCVVAGVGNAENTDSPVSVLINRRLDDGDAARLAGRLGGIPVVRQWDDRRSEDAVLILGRNWAQVSAGLAP